MQETIPLEDYLNVQLFRQLFVAVSDGDFRHARHIGHLALGSPVAAKNGGDVDRGCGHARGATARGQLLFRSLPQDLDSLGLHLALQIKAAAKAGNVVDGARGHELQGQLAGYEPVGSADLLSGDSGHLGDLVQGARHVALAACSIKRRSGHAFDAPPANEVLVHGLAVDHGCRLPHVSGQTQG